MADNGYGTARRISESQQYGILQSPAGKVSALRAEYAKIETQRKSLEGQYPRSKARIGIDYG